MNQEHNCWLSHSLRLSQHLTATIGQANAPLTSGIRSTLNLVPKPEWMKDLTAENLTKAPQQEAKWISLAGCCQVTV